MTDETNSDTEPTKQRPAWVRGRMAWTSTSGETFPAALARLRVDVDPNMPDDEWKEDDAEYRLFEQVVMVDGNATHVVLARFNAGTSALFLSPTDKKPEPRELRAGRNAVAFPDLRAALEPGVTSDLEAGHTETPAAAAAGTARPKWVQGPMVWSSETKPTEPLQQALRRLGVKDAGPVKEEWTSAGGDEYYRLLANVHDDGAKFRLIAGAFADGSSCLFRCPVVDD